MRGVALFIVRGGQGQGQTGWGGEEGGVQVAAQEGGCWELPGGAPKSLSIIWVLLPLEERAADWQRALRS